MPDDEAPQSRSVWPLTSIIVGVLLLALLGAMILPVVGTVRGPSRQANCGKNMSQLLGAMVAYSTAEEVAWPLPTPLPARRTMDAHVARQVTCQLFALLARHQTLPMALFSCEKAHRRAPPRLTGPETPVDWGMNDAGVVTYAMDWTSPADPSSARVVLADRDPLAHGDGTMACFGDCHVKKLKTAPLAATRAATVLVTEGLNGKSIQVRAVNPEAAPDRGSKIPDDDIYSDDGDDRDDDEDGDGGDFRFDALSPGQGHPVRAWVK